MHKFKTIDYTSATHELKDLLFDVKKVSMVTTEDDMECHDFSGIRIKNYVSLINASNKDVLCVVSYNYELFTNYQAIEFGKKAFVQLFPDVKEEDLIPYKVVSTQRKTSCHIDLIHKNVNFNVWEQETWLPFIRITNSYNRKLKFSLELGFVRKLCSNGIIFDKKTIVVKYSHTKGDIPVSISADISKLKGVEREFKASLLNLQRFHVPRKMAFPLVCKAFDLKWKGKSQKLSSINDDSYVRFKEKSEYLTKVYMDIDGETAFSVMNVLTDLVSHQDEYRCLPQFSFRATHYSYKISEWMREFCEKAEDRKFSVKDYLGEFASYIEN